MQTLSWQTRIYIGAMEAAALGLAIMSLASWNSGQNFRFFMYLIMTLGAANLKVKLPGITGAISMTFVFVLISVTDLSLPQVLVIGMAGTGGTLFFRTKSRNLAKLGSNLATSVVTSGACFATFHSSWLRRQDESLPMLLLFASAVHFLMNTGSIAIVIALTERKSAWRVWKESFLWTASHNMVGAGIATIFHAEERYLGWQATLLTIPLVYLVYRSYSLHLERLEGARKHAQEMGDLHWRTIEALALAIDAKDETTHNHLLRVKVYATEIAKELGLDELQMQAIQAAALLHDIGKLAVPEHIISKPGKLTHEEFDQMKIHPVVGAEILERVRFPYPVAPIVHAHHEKWNGKGYPDGLKGEEIPIGARILSAVDCLDALASDRQYRKALPLHEAMAIVEKESGLSYDPKIVAILKRRYVELEHIATSIPVVDEPKLSRSVRVDAGDGPATGYADLCVVSPNAMQIDFLEAMTATKREFYSLMRIVEELGTYLTMDEALILMMNRLKRMIPHSSSAVFVRRGERLLPVHSSAEAECWVPQEVLTVGEGLTGWCAETHQPIVNGNPSVEAGYYCLGRPLLSALAVPLEVEGNVVASLTLYSVHANAFTQDHLRVLLQVGSKAAASIASSLERDRLTTVSTERTAA